MSCSVVPEVEKDNFQIPAGHFCVLWKSCGKRLGKIKKISLGETVRVLSNSTTLGRELGREETSGKFSTMEGIHPCVASLHPAPTETHSDSIFSIILLCRDF